MSNKPKYIKLEGTSPAHSKFMIVSRIESGPLYFVAGQVAIGFDGNVVGKGDFEAQFHQVFKNLKAVLDGLGASHTDIVKFNTYLVREQDIELFIKLRSEYFPTIFDGPFPPNTLVVVKRLFKEEFLLEVDCVIAGNK